MIDKKKYSDMMNEIHVPSEVLGKVINMKKETKFINKKKLLRNLAATAAAIGAVFVASNGICYAASGKTWVESVIVYINGEPTEQEITYTQNGDYVEGSMSFDVDDDSSFQIDFGVSEDAVDNDANKEFSYDVKEYPSGNGSYLETRDGKLYLVIPEVKTIDITGELDDGICEGEFVIDESIKYTYTITGTTEEYNIDISMDAVSVE